MFASMVQWLHKLLFIAISISFFISATEMDLGECHNTFFDEYDTYVKTEQVSVDHPEAIQQQQAVYELVSFLFGCYHPVTEARLYRRPGYPTVSASPPKIFLRNSVWRI